MFVFKSVASFFHPQYLLRTSPRSIPCAWNSRIWHFHLNNTLLSRRNVWNLVFATSRPKLMKLTCQFRFLAMTIRPDIRVCLETRLLGQKRGFEVPEWPCSRHSAVRKQTSLRRACLLEWCHLERHVAARCIVLKLLRPLWEDIIGNSFGRAWVCQCENCSLIFLRIPHFQSQNFRGRHPPDQIDSDFLSAKCLRNVFFQRFL